MGDKSYLIGFALSSSGQGRKLQNFLDIKMFRRTRRGKLEFFLGCISSIVIYLTKKSIRKTHYLIFISQSIVLEKVQGCTYMAFFC